METIFVVTRDIQVLGLKFLYSFYKSGIEIKEKEINLEEYEYYYYYQRMKPQEMVKKFIITRHPQDWIAKEQDKLNDELLFQRQSYYYYYFYNQDEDDDTYYQQRREQPRQTYDVSCFAIYNKIRFTHTP